MLTETGNRSVIATEHTNCIGAHVLRLSTHWSHQTGFVTPASSKMVILYCRIGYRGLMITVHPKPPHPASMPDGLRRAFAEPFHIF